jgi:cytochrome c oxidase subunit II
MDRKRLIGLLSAALVATLVTGAGVRSASASAAAEQVIHMTAKKFEYNPSEITVKKGTPVVIEIVSLDRKHGFTIPELNIRMDVKPGEKNVVRFTPDRAGTFNFHCDNFCGEGHEGMAGKLIVEE